MIQSRFPKGNFIVEDCLELFSRQEPVRRRILTAVLLGTHKIFGRAINSEIERRFGSERFDATRRLGLRIFEDKIDMRLFVHVVEKGKRRRKNKNANRSRHAEANNNPAQLWFG